MKIRWHIAFISYKYCQGIRISSALFFDFVLEKKLLIMFNISVFFFFNSGILCLFIFRYLFFGFLSIASRVLFVVQLTSHATPNNMQLLR